MPENNSNDAVVHEEAARQFADALCSILQEKFGEDYKIEYMECAGLNGTRKQGFFIVDKRMEAGEYIHLQQWKGWNRSWCGVEECADWILQGYEQHAPELPAAKMEAERVSSWENAKDRVLPFLVSYEGNEEFLEPLVYERKLDLAVGCYIRAELVSGNVYVKKSLLERWEITEEELMEQAVVNLAKEGYLIQGIEEVIKEMTGVPWEDECRIPMMVMSNRDKRMGAAGILDEGLLKECSDQIDDSLYLLPSSIHEIMVVPAGFTEDPQDLKEIVCEINQEIVLQEERLSDHVYFYDREKGEISIAA